MTEESVCLYCGKSFTATCHITRQKYCSRDCCVKYNNANRYYGVPVDACPECGATVKQNGKQGRWRRYCSDDCRKAYNDRKGAEKRRTARNEPRVCPNCGKDFVPVWKTGPARFCSDECRIEWWKDYHKHNPSSESPIANCAYCGCEMRGGRKYCSRACYRLGAARVRGERVCAWCGKLLSKKARSTQKYCCTKCAKASWGLSHSGKGQRRCIQAKNPGAWRRQLMELAKETVFQIPKDSRILLVCGTMNLVSTDTLVNFIRFGLCCDPFDGNTYVFCNSGFSHLKWLCWDGGGFCVGSRQAEWGKYPWPPDREGAVIEITSREFTFIRNRGIDGQDALNH